MARTKRAEEARAEQDLYVDEWLRLHPEKAEHIVRLRKTWLGRMAIISLLLGKEEAHRRFGDIEMLKRLKEVV